MNSAGASAGTLRALSLLMPRSTSMATSTSLAAARLATEHGDEFRRVAAQDSVALFDAVHEIEIFLLHELLRLGDVLSEGIQGHDGLDAGERIVARLLGA